MRKIWKDIQGYEGLYQVSNYGEVRSIDREVLVKGFHKAPINGVKKGRILKQRMSDDGYATVALCKNGICKNYKVHRLVGMCFIENPNNHNEINHIDGDKTNNNALNLEWCTHFQNMQHCFQNNLRKTVVNPMIGRTYENSPNSKRVIQYDLKMNFIKEWGSVREASEFVGVDSSNIGRCCNGYAKTCKGYIWSYKSE